MAQSDAYLLRIPREIRNQILSYVHHEVTFPWKWSRSRSRQLALDVTIPYAPQPSVLLTCSRLYEEYMQQRADKSMMIRWSGGVKRSHYRKRDVNELKYIQAFGRVENFELVIDLTRLRKEGEAPWSTGNRLECFLMDELFDFFKPHLPRLASIVVFSRMVAAVDASEPWQPRPFGPPRPEEASTGPVPDRLGGLQLVHFARALCLYSNIDHRYWREWRTGRVEWNHVKDSIYQLQVRYYASESHKILQPTRAQVQAHWKSYTITDEQAKQPRRLEKHQMEAFDEPECRMWDWEDFSGGGVYASKDVFRADADEKGHRRYPYVHADRRQAEEPEQYFNWDEIMIVTSDDASG
jgi:hypothetical protein